MTNPEQDLLITSEGVDEGSAASTAEGPGSGASPAGGRATAPDEGPTPPVDMQTDESADSTGPGQELQVGEG